MLVAVMLFIAGVATAAVLLKKLSVAGAICGALIAFFMYLGFGWPGILLLGGFFITGTIVTNWHLRGKAAAGLSENHSGKRVATQVLANGGLAGLTGLLAFAFPMHNDLFYLMAAASLASASSDTVSSELGNVYGRNFYNILSFKKDRRGENGVVSLEGSIAGVFGAMLIAGLYQIGDPGLFSFFTILAGGMFGNLVDSFLGASLERKGYLGNNLVNLFNTIAAAIFALIIYYS